MADEKHTVIALREARARGLKFYFTGRPCSRGHTAPRFVSCASCAECVREKSRSWYSDRNRSREKTRKWRAKNRDRDQSNARKWRQANKDRVAKYSQEWDAKNRIKRHSIWKAWYTRNIERQRKRARQKRAEKIEYYRAHSREYNAKNLPRMAAIQRNRTARKRRNGGTHTAADVELIYAAQKGKCACCKKMVGKKYNVDHIIALARGGLNSKKNLQILCASCNQHKNARDPIEFMQSRGFLL